MQRRRRAGTPPRFMPPAMPDSAIPEFRELSVKLLSRITELLA